MFIFVFAHCSFAKQKVGLVITTDQESKQQADLIRCLESFLINQDLDTDLVHYVLSSSIDSSNINPLLQAQKLAKNLAEQDVKKIIIIGTNCLTQNLLSDKKLESLQNTLSDFIKSIDRKNTFILGLCIAIEDLLPLKATQKNILAENKLKHEGDANKKVLQKIIINPASKPSNIFKVQDLQVNNNGWISFCTPVSRSQFIPTNKSFLNALQKSRYQIVGFSEIGSAEIFCDSDQNLYFAFSPQYFFEKSKDGKNLVALKEDPVLLQQSHHAMQKLFIDFFKKR